MSGDKLSDYSTPHPPPLNSDLKGNLTAHGCCHGNTSRDIPIGAEDIFGRGGGKLKKRAPIQRERLLLWEKM